jgi:hypothetical protein
MMGAADALFDPALASLRRLASRSLTDGAESVN